MLFIQPPAPFVKPKWQWWHHKMPLTLRYLHEWHCQTHHPGNVGRDLKLFLFKTLEWEHMEGLQCCFSRCCCCCCGWCCCCCCCCCRLSDCGEEFSNHVDEVNRIWQGWWSYKHVWTLPRPQGCQIWALLQNPPRKHQQNIRHITCDFPSKSPSSVFVSNEMTKVPENFNKLSSLQSNFGSARGSASIPILSAKKSASKAESPWTWQS